MRCGRIKAVTTNPTAKTISKDKISKNPHDRLVKGIIFQTFLTYFKDDMDIVIVSCFYFFFYIYNIRSINPLKQYEREKYFNVDQLNNHINFLSTQFY